MWHLVKLSDKYIVPSLYEDVRVRHCLRLYLMRQTYSFKLIAEQRPRSFTLWKYSARYSLRELEKYCRSDPKVFAIINYVLRQPNMGLAALMKYGIPLEMVNVLVMDMAPGIPQENMQCSGLGSRCQGPTDDWGSEPVIAGGVCGNCLSKVASLEVDLSKEMKWPYSG